YRCPAEDIEVSPRTRGEQQLKEKRWEPECPSCGTQLEPMLTPERKPLAPTSVYAVNKRDHEELFLAWAHAYGVAATALRFFNVYGPRQALSNPYTGVAAIFASRLLNRRTPIVFEDGRQSRDFVHVSDVVDAVARALEPGAADFRALNVGTGKPTSVLEVAEVLGRHLGAELGAEVNQQYRAGDIRHCFSDPSLARELLGFAAQVDFESGMSELCDWLATQEATDLIEQATAILAERGLTR